MTVNGLSEVEVPTSVGVSPETTNSYSQSIASAPEVHETIAPVVDIPLTAKSIGDGHEGHTAVIVPDSIFTFSAPDPTTVPSVSRMS